MGKTAQIVINLEPNLEEFVRDEVKRGSFSSGSEYVENILRERYEDDRIRQEQELADALAVGHEDIKAGRFMPLDEAFAKLRAELGLDKLRVK
jgi:antitoxin ParD1/3/4